MTAQTNLLSSINITGGTPKQRTLLLEAAQYYLTALIQDDRIAEVELNIHLKKNLNKHQGTKGSCIWEDDRKKPREFEIEFDSTMTTQALLEFLAHECVHVKQYVTGEMIDTNTYGVVIWKGEKIDMKKRDYYFLPWEVEAYGMEVGLYNNYVKEFKYASKNWYRDTDFPSG